MLALSAVEPDRSRGIFNLVCESPVGYILCVGGRDESRPEAVVHGGTWRVEGSLGDGVVLGPETESDCVTLGGGNGIRLEDQLASLGTNRNLVVHSGRGANKGSGGSEERSEEHCDRLW